MIEEERRLLLLGLMRQLQIRRRLRRALCQLQSDSGRPHRGCVGERKIIEGDCSGCLRSQTGNVHAARNNYVRTSCKVRLYGMKLTLWHEGI